MVAEPVRDPIARGAVALSSSNREPQAEAQECTGSCKTRRWARRASPSASESKASRSASSRAVDRRCCGTWPGATGKACCATAPLNRAILGPRVRCCNWHQVFGRTQRNRKQCRLRVRAGQHCGGQGRPGRCGARPAAKHLLTVRDLPRTQGRHGPGRRSHEGRHPARLEGSHACRGQLCSKNCSGGARGDPSEGRGGRPRHRRAGRRPQLEHVHAGCKTLGPQQQPRAT